MPHTLSPHPCNLTPLTARHYNSALSIWLSVDPMSDKYPGVSPYMYCANNPVVLKDPNGRDVYDFDKKGNLIHTIKNTDNDIIRVVNKRGRVISSKTYDYGTVIKDNSDDSKFDKTTLSIKDDESRTLIFEQLASNTNVEWATINATKEEDGKKEERNYISNSGSRKENAMTDLVRQLYADGFTANEVSHSHRKKIFGSNCPSGYGFLGDQVAGGDREAFLNIRKLWSNVVVKVFDANNRHYYELGPTKDDIIDINTKGERKPYNPYGQ